MQRAVLHAIYRLLFALRQAWFRIARPKTFGVRVLIRHRETGAFLLIRHSYGARHLWYPPGGGYSPTRETAEDAARREVREEVGVELDRLQPLDLYLSEKGGNRDTVTLFLAETSDRQIMVSGELAEGRWIAPMDLAGLRLGRVSIAALTQAGVTISDI